MLKKTKIGIAAIAFCFAFLFYAIDGFCTGVEQTKKAGTTLENLMAAYNGESNANARYLEFAKKADEEGYLKVAVLFRAAAKSEMIHAKNHARVIKQLKGTLKTKIEIPEVGSTKENLEAAIKGESYERDTMYPEFIEQAKKDNNQKAVRTLTLAKGAEANHAKLYSDALNNLEGWKAPGAVFYDCGVCGNTVEKVDFKKCPVCGESRILYFKVK